jgi:hypothetical protein
MNRILLTLLALLTGLTAQAGPAQAQLCAGNAAANAAVGGTECVQRAVAIRAACINDVMSLRERQVAQRAQPALAQQAIIPAVLFGSDRAYE